MSHPIVSILRAAEGWHDGLESWISVSEGIRDEEADVFIGDEDDDIGDRYLVIFARECSHEREGVVTNQPGVSRPDLSRPFSSMATCGRGDCIKAAQRWVAAGTNESATYVPDERKS